CTVFVRIFAADIFRPEARAVQGRWDLPAVSHSRGPGCREDVWIIDGEQKLKPLAAVIEIHDRRITFSRVDRVVLEGALNTLFGLIIIEEPIALDNMQGWGLRRAEPVDHGKRPRLDGDGVDDQSVAVVMTDGITVIGRRDLRRMRAIHAHNA